MGKERKTSMCLTTSKLKKTCYDMGRNFSKIWKTSSLYKKINKGHKLISLYPINFLENYIAYIKIVTFNFTSGWGNFKENNKILSMKFNWDIDSVS